MLKRLLFSLVAMLPVVVFSQEVNPNVEKPDLHMPSLITPYYFGPNAFPIPDMLDGRLSDQLRIELAGEHYAGFSGDKTNDVALKITVPVFSDRINITGWIPIEWYQQSDANIIRCGLEDMDKEYSKVRKGHCIGDAILTTDVRILKEKKYRPDLTLRIGLHTASSVDYYLGRYYDAPGYYFDTSIAKSFSLGGDPTWNHRLRMVASFGFLCWQTLTGRQDDAVMYGYMMKYENKYFSVSEAFNGYDGWEYTLKDAGEYAHDAPGSLKTKVDVFLGKHWEVTAGYLHGLFSYPYNQVRLGVVYKMNILPKK